MTFVMAGGGTGGHVMPLLAVAEELRGRGHAALFIGTREGIEARLAPARGFEIEFIAIGGLKRVAWQRRLRTLAQLPVSVLRAARLMLRARAAAVFSLGGYVAGPTVMAALSTGIPVVAMEPNAVPGVTNLRLGRYVAKTLVGFEEALRFFPAGKVELTGLPIGEAFFAVRDKPRGEVLTALITGGSRGSRTFNRAARESWPLFRGKPVRLIHQCGLEEYDGLAAGFSQSGVQGEVVPFIDTMPAAMAEADIVVARAGAGTVLELAAAGKPAILAPFPYAADDHQLRNAESMARAGAAEIVMDRELNGETLFRRIMALASEPGRLEEMARRARSLGRRGAARRAAGILEEEAARYLR